MPDRARQVFIYGVLACVLLIAYGLIRFPAVVASPSSVVGIVLILGMYGALGWLLPPMLQLRSPAILRAAGRTGLLAGLIFLVEMALEYILLPADNSVYGLVEYGLVLALCFAAALWISHRNRRWLDGLLSALWSGLVASLIFIGVIFIFFYLFNGTQRQLQVLTAEGSLADFARSGMTDLNIFLMGDYLGAGFFHSLLLPLSAVLLGMAGALIGRFTAPARGARKTSGSSAKQPD
jgi:hypothetical protein